MRKEYKRRRRMRRHYGPNNKYTVMTSILITSFILLLIGVASFFFLFLMRPGTDGSGDSTSIGSIGQDDADSPAIDGEAETDDADVSLEGEGAGNDADPSNGGEAGDTGSDADPSNGGEAGDTGSDADPSNDGEAGDTGSDADPSNGGEGGDTGSDADSSNGGEAGDTGSDADSSNGGEGGDSGSGTDAPAPDAETEKPGNGTEDEDGEYSFENTLFIGDSRTEGLLINTGLADATFYAVRGLAVDNIYEKKFVPSGKKQKKVTVMKALEKNSFRKIYIMLGVNELGWAFEDIFIEKYAQLIRDIKALQPDTEIVVQSILPVTKEKSDGDAVYNNKKIYRYNELIEDMCEDEGVTYADLIPAVAGKNGALPKDGSSDGVHLTKSYYLKWLDYIISQKF